MRILVVFAALILVLALPFALKPKENLLAKADDTVVIITPHNEQIRYEFSHAFSASYKKATGRSVRIDWRVPGGTSEIAKYLKGEFFAAFEYFWKTEGHRWDAAAANTFDKSGANSPARQGFLASNVGIGIDLFFGGGAYDFIQQAEAGRLVDCGLLTKRPEWFTEATIPHIVSGEVYYDEGGRWIGAVLSSFGICYNSDSLRRLGVKEIPASWSDLCNPLFRKQVALADPTKSGSAAKAFEMIIQQKMQEVVRSHPEAPVDSLLPEGWLQGLQVIQHASANARYFTDAAPKVPIDVSLGDAAIGMCIDFYGRYQSEAVQVGDTPSRIQYFTPVGGSSVGVDPIGLLRGAPNRKAAVAFMEFVLSEEGQKLWNFKVGAPGGPVKYALRRLPIRKELYAPEFAAYRSDPTVFPYEDAKLFTYHPKWTGSLFKTMSFIIRVMCLDCHKEQASAWKALVTANFPPEATAKFNDLSAVDFSTASDLIRPALKSADRIQEVQIAKKLGAHFRAQYRQAEQLAKEGK
jgi:iron(III) transport system substrate-binding protein